MDKVKGSVLFSNGPKKVAMNSVLLAPVPIRWDNLNLVIDGGWVKKDVVCQGVKMNVPAACK
jgi:D-xylose transport system substrate-binding protein